MPILPRLCAWLSGLVLLSSLPVMAASELQVPEFFSVRSVNGVPQRADLLSRDRSLSVPEGEVLLELRYSDVVQASLGDSHTNFRSDWFAVRFQASAGKRYRLQAPRPESEVQAAAFSREPRVQVVDAGQGGAPAQTWLSPQQWRELLTARPLPAPAPATPAAPPVTPAPAGVAPAASTSLVADNLWYWWQQADEATRRAFLQRVQP